MIDPPIPGSPAGSDVVGDFKYGPGAVDLRFSLSIFADRPGLRDELREDAMGFGYRVAVVGDLAALATLLDGDPAPGEARLSDVMLVDCPQLDGTAMAALARLDLRAARTGASLVVSTSIDALDAVFGCLDQSQPQILVAPSRAERLIAMGQALSRRSASVRDLSEADRMVLMRLAEQVNAIGARLERLKCGGEPELREDPDRSRLAEATSAFRFPTAGGAGDRLIPPRGGEPKMPPASLLRKVIRQRSLRARYFPRELFADPAWDMLLDLSVARAEQVSVSVTSLSIASGAAPTTALRWIAQMTEAGLLRREADPHDRRRAFIVLTDTAAEGMARYFAALGRELAPVL